MSPLVTDSAAKTRQAKAAIRAAHQLIPSGVDRLLVARRLRQLWQKRIVTLRFSDVDWGAEIALRQAGLTGRTSSIYATITFKLS